jgi:uncharacterized protein YcbX
MDGQVAWIQVAPVKALGLVGLDETVLTADGVVENRRFHLADARGTMINGKRLGHLVRIRPAYDEATRRLELRFPDGETVAGQVQLGEPVSTRFFGRSRPGRLVEGPWSAALSDYVGAPVRLVEAARPGAAVDRGRDGAVSLLSAAAAEALGLDPRRFRMLLGIAGVPAHAEDDWIGARVRVGEAVVTPTGHTGRCLITSQDPDTGVRDRDVLETLRGFRPPDTTEPLAFGVQGAVVEPGRVRVGDPVTVS